MRRLFSKCCTLFYNLNSLIHIVITSVGCTASLYPGIFNKNVKSFCRGRLIVYFSSAKQMACCCYLILLPRHYSQLSAVQYAAADKMWALWILTLISDWHLTSSQHIFVWHFALGLLQILHIASFDFLLTPGSQIIRLSCWHLAWSE